MIPRARPIRGKSRVGVGAKPGSFYILVVPRLEALALLPPLWLFASGCGSDCAPIECSPAVIVRAELSSPVSATLEGSVRLCHRTSCLEAELALDPADSAGWEIRFDESLSAARFAAEGERWTLEAEIHPASPNGFVAGDPGKSPLLVTPPAGSKGAYE